MKKRLFILTLLSTAVSSFATPISTPNNVNDTPIVSNGGGTVGGSGQCQAYQSDGAVVNLSGGETLVFYGGSNPLMPSAGGYLFTKSTYSGTAYLKIKYFGSYGDGSNYYSGKAIGLFAKNSDQQSDFIAGAGASGGANKVAIGDGFHLSSGGGWETRVGTSDAVSSYSLNDLYNPYSLYMKCGTNPSMAESNIYSGSGFFSNISSGANDRFHGIGFFNGGDASFYYFNDPKYIFTTIRVDKKAQGCDIIGNGGVSSISAFYNYYTKQYTLAPLSYTIFGGGVSSFNSSAINGIIGVTPSFSGSEPILYVCK